ncbi:MAG: alcohol dehydrogenase [Flavipsychrobacter sp.]|jgi:voltage-dependent potassium channel beta subunit|nr:alcohol dehydrogenase [Flavipsychrobacter sp.]
MEYRKMGKTGLKLSVLSYGSWVTFSKQLDDSAADRMMGIAYDSGINFFDNAEVYEGGRSEEIMGRVLKSKNWDRTSYCVSSKAFFGLHGKNNKPTQHGLSRKHLTEACNAALQRLQVDYLDLFYCHRPDPETPMEEIVWTMNILLNQGKILYWGTSMWSAVEIMEAHTVATRLHLIGPAVEQTQYNLFERDKIEHEYLNIFKDVGMGTTIYSPLANGFLSGKYNNGVPDDSRMALKNYGWIKDRYIQEEKIGKVKKLAEVAKALDTSLATLAIAWCIHNPHVTSAILGATKEEQLTENLQAVEVCAKLTPSVLEEIEGIMQAKLI